MTTELKGLALLPTIDPSWMAQLTLTTVHAVLQPEREWQLPPRVSVTVRGALGAAMFDVACQQAHRRCADCAARSSCLLPTWYDPSLGGGHDPRPFALQVEPRGRSVVAPPTPLHVRVRFFGPLPEPELVVQALTRAAESGLGPQRVRHRLTQLTVTGSDAPAAVVRDGERVQAWPTPGLLTRQVQLPLEPRGARVRLISPLQLKVRGAAPTPGELVDAAIGRVRGLARQLGERVDRRWPATEHLPGEWRELRFAQASRKPSSGRGSHDLSGWLGELALGHEALPFVDLLAAAELLHIGRSSSSGLGRVAVTWL